MLNIRKLRKAAGFSQEQLAEMVGTSTVCICRYENGSRNPNPPMLGKIASALGCKIDDLLEKEEAS